jgi:hypothetical protein
VEVKGKGKERKGKGRRKGEERGGENRTVEMVDNDS